MKQRIQTKSFDRLQSYCAMVVPSSTVRRTAALAGFAVVTMKWIWNPMMVSFAMLFRALSFMVSMAMIVVVTTSAIMIYMIPMFVV